MTIRLNRRQQLCTGSLQGSEHTVFVIKRLDKFTSNLPNFKNRLRIMFSLIHLKYNILRRYALKSRRNKEGLQSRVAECALFSKDAVRCGS